MSRKKIAIISVTTIIIIAIILASFMYITKTRDKEVETISKEFYENGWDKDIVAMIKEDIPVPVGFEYVTGNKDEGLIIKNAETQKQYMWIPAVELSELNDVSKYFNETYDEYCFTEEDTFKSVNQYGGFYIELSNNSNELYESLKNMSEEEYKAKAKEIQKEYNIASSVESNIINKDELAAILTWNPNLISSIGTTSMTLGLSISSSDNYYSGNYSDYDEDLGNVVSEIIDEVPIPKGFSYVEGNKLNGLLIEDNKNSNLQYVWIPVDSRYNVSNIEDAKEELIEYAREHDLLYDIIEEWEKCNENLPSELVRSVKKYGGFYMSVAELGYDNQGKDYNKFRGMNVVPGGLYANIGDYYRYVKPESYKTQYPAVVQKQKEGLTYAKAISISKNLYSSNSSVVSHLTYGAEWDAAMLWLKNYNGLYAVNLSSEQRTADVMLKDSSEIGKYKDKQVKEDGDKTGNIWNTKLLNSLWGLAGNLSELTQEKYNGQIVLRGGSWANTGSDMPITSRMFMSESEVNNSTDTTIGFRTCLYIKLDKNYNDEYYEEDCNCYYCDCDYCDTGDCDCAHCYCEEYYDEDYWEDEYEERCNCYYCDCDYCDTGDCDCAHCYCEEYYDEDYWDDDDSYNYSEVNVPQLAEGMIPVRYNGSNWVVVSEKSSKWYNYEDKQWANVMLSDGKYDADEVKEGQVIKENDMGSMLVWIPRFAYSIENGYHTSTRGNIEIEFLQGTTNKDWNGNTYKTDYDEENVDNIDKNTEMIVHPAFDDNGKKEGIWVGKFESSKNSSRIAIKPNKTAWTGLKYSAAESYANNMKSESTYGIKSSKVNTYLMKNSEWGAVAYLTLSEYGKGTEIYINNNSSRLTGMSAGSVSASSSASTSNKYDTTKGKGASTTGNIYGIYDLSGGVWEYVDAEEYNFSGSAYNNYDKSSKIKGGAIYETSKSYTGSTAWYQDASVYPSNNNALIRGGSFNDKTSAGIFAFNNTSASSTNSNVGFRVVLTVR